MKRFNILRLLLSILLLVGCSEQLLAPTARITLETGGLVPAPGDAGGAGDDSLFSVPIGYRVTLDGSGSSDPNGQPLAYRWRLVAAPRGSLAAIEATDATVTWVSPDAAGDYVIELVVSDGALTSTPAIAQFTAGPCGAHTPKVVAIKAASIAPHAGDPVLLSATVTDTDLDKACNGTEHFSYEWSLVEVPRGSRATLNDPALEKPSLLTDEPGTYRVELVVTDALGHASDRFEVSVRAGGCPVLPPELVSVSASNKSPSLAQQVTLASVVKARSLGSTGDGGTSGIPVGCEDQHFTHHWTIVSVPTGSAVSLVDSPLQNPSFQPDESGDYVAELYVTSDDGRRSETKSVTVSASSCGSRSPVVSAKATPESPALGQAVSLTASVRDPDAEAPCAGTEHFSYSWALSKVPAGSTAHLNDTSLASPSFIVDVTGTYEATVTVTDSLGHQSPAAQVSTVASACGGNAPTVGNVTATPAAPNTGAVVVLDATPTDADNLSPCALSERVSLSWALRSVPAGSVAALSGTDQSSPWFLADLPGTYDVEVEAVDAKGHRSAAKSVSIQAATCGSAAPVIGAVSATPAAPNTGDVVSLSATVSDADTNPTCGLKESFTLTWSIVSAPAGSTAVLSAPHGTSPWFSADEPGAYTVEALVTDSKGHTSAGKRATIQVAACGSAAPTISSITVGPSTPTVGKNVTLSASVADSDTTTCGKSETFSYAWALTRVPQGSAAVLSGTTTPLSGFLADLAGTYTVALAVTDSEGHTSALRSENVIVPAASSCGTNTPVARLAAMTAEACPPLVTCSAATITPPVSSQPSPSPPNHVVRLNGHPSVKLDASASFDADRSAPCSKNTPLTYEWTIRAAPVGASPFWSVGTGETTRMVAPTFVPDLPGVYQVGLVVSDGEHTSAELVVQIVL